MYLIVEFEYFDWTKLTDADYADVRKVVPSLPDTCPKYGAHGSHLLNEMSFPVLAKHAIPFRLSRDEASQSVATMLVKLQDRIDALEMRESRYDLAKLAEKGCVAQIAIPDLALMRITEVTYLDDACTDRLQGYLDAGWRILAVCPPNAQRRPDYILGRVHARESE